MYMVVSGANSLSHEQCRTLTPAAAYLCLFGALILLAEMRNAYVLLVKFISRRLTLMDDRYFLENFKFLLSYPGRGAFYIFCGSLALANTGMFC
jgi:hypothetical protein